MVGGDVEELLRGSRALPSQFVDQGLVGCAREEGVDDICASDVGQFITLSRESPYVVIEGFIRLLLAVLQVPRVFGMSVSPLEVPHEDFPQFHPAPDGVGG